LRQRKKIYVLPTGQITHLFASNFGDEKAGEILGLELLRHVESVNEVLLIVGRLEVLLILAAPASS
jgi:hypothetical protein